MRLTKVTAALLLNLVALGAIPSMALAAGPSSHETKTSSPLAKVFVKAESDSGDDGNESDGHDGQKQGGYANTGTGLSWGASGSSSSGSRSSSSGSSGSVTTTVVVPPVIIKPDGDGFGDDGWTPPAKPPKITPNAGSDPASTVLPFGNNPAGASSGTRKFVGGGAVNPPVGSTKHKYVLSPVSPSEAPAVQNAETIPGPALTSTKHSENIDPVENQAVVVDRSAYALASPMQQFIDQATIILVILGALSLGLISLAVRNGRVSRRETKA
jgi:hypothetical protein